MRKKWDAIKKTAVEIFYDTHIGNHGFPTSASFLAMSEALQVPCHPRDVLKDWVDQGCEIINRWDIRMVSKLVELFPDCVPTGMRNGRLAAYQDENGTWMVERAA